MNSKNFKNKLDKVEKSYYIDIETNSKTIVDYILNDIYGHYTVLDENNKKITINKLKDKYISYIDNLMTKNSDKYYQCTAICRNQKRCILKSLKDTHYMYCKKHFFTDSNESADNDYTTNSHDNSNTPTIIQSLSPHKPLPHLDFNKYDKIFIKDKLYYTTKKLIYTQNKIKCGYIKYISNEEPQYILTEDPFILDQYEE